MLRDVMNMRKEADESVRDCISRIQHKLNRLDALLLERKINLSALLRKNHMLEIIGVDCVNSYSWLKDYRPNN